MFVLSDKMFVIRGWTAARSEVESSEDLVAEEYLMVCELRRRLLRLCVYVACRSNNVCERWKHGTLDMAAVIQ